MAANEVSVVAKLIDQVSPGLRVVGAGLAKFGKTALSAFSGLLKSILSIRTALFGLGAFMVAKFSSQFVNATADSQTALLVLSRQANVTAESLTAMSYAAEMSGSSSNELKDAILQLRNKMGDALRGTKNQVEAFNRLGLSARDLATGKLDLVDFFGKVAEGLKDVGTEAEKSRLLVDLFGETGATRLMPLLSEGAEGLRKFSDEARQFGRVFDESSLKASESFVAAKTKMSAAIKGIRDTFFVELYPALADFITNIAKFVAENRTVVLEGMKEFALGILDVLKSISGAFDTLRAGLSRDQAVEYVRLTDWLDKAKKAYEQNTIALVAMVEERRRLGAMQIIPVDSVIEADRQIAKMQADLERVGSDIQAAENRIRELQSERNRGSSATQALGSLRDRIAAIDFKKNAGALKQQGVEPGEKPAGTPEESTQQTLTSWQKVKQGVTDGMKAYVESLGTMQQMAAQAAQNFASGFGDIVTDGFMGIIDGSMKAKDAFKQMALDMLKMIARLIVQFAVLNAVKAGIGGLFGVSLPGAGAASGPAMAAGGGGGDFGGGAGGGASRSSVTTNSTISINITTPDAGAMKTLLYQERQTFIGIIAEAMKTNRSFRLAMQG